MWVITHKGKMIQEGILDYIQKHNYPISTREICLKLGFSWHTVQQYCLELQLKERISRLEVAGTHLWTPNGFVVKSNRQISQQEENVFISKEEGQLLFIKLLEQEARKLEKELEKEAEINVHLQEVRGWDENEKQKKRETKEEERVKINKIMKMFEGEKE